MSQFLANQNADTIHHTSIQKMKDDSLLESVKTLVREERRLTLEILHHLREIERRRLYAARGFSSLFEYCRHELGYSEAAAQRRISSMRLLKELPELEKKIESGAISLTAVSQAQSFFRREEKIRKTMSRNEREDLTSNSSLTSAPTAVLTSESKLEILRSLEGKSAREAERALLAFSSQPEAHAQSEKVRVVSESLTELKFSLTKEEMEMLEKLKGALGHRLQEVGYKQVIEYAVRFTLDHLKKDKALRKERGKDKADVREQILPETKLSQSLPAPEVKEGKNKGSYPAFRQACSPLKPSRYIPEAARRLVFTRDQAQCTYRDPMTQRRCTSRYQLEIDHIIPYARGGESKPKNLRLLCRTHNQYLAARVFGNHMMEKYRRP